MADSNKVSVTKNYRLFGTSPKNRPLDMAKHKKLLESMKLYGFLPEFPIVCYRDEHKHLIAKDGQHRLMIAETLKLPVYWREQSIDWDVALVNGTPRPWVLRDFAANYAARGLTAYQDGLDFADSHGIPIGIAFALLAGCTGFTNIRPEFADGTYKVKDRDWADRVAATYSPVVKIDRRVRVEAFIAACMAACRVDGFEPSRFVHNAQRCREKLGSYSTRDAYLEMMETIYNFGRKSGIPLKFAALQAMRDRNPANGKAATNGKAKKV